MLTPVNYHFFIEVCAKGDLEVAKRILFVENKISIITSVNAFLSACQYGKINVVEWLINTFDLSISYYSGFRKACICNQLDVAKFLLFNKYVEPIKISNALFELVCHNDFFEIAKWLYYIKGNRINIKEEAELIFKISLCNNNLNMAMWVYSLSNVDEWPDKINTMHKAFAKTLWHGNLEFAKWIFSIAYVDVKKCVREKFLTIPKWKCNPNFIRWIGSIIGDDIVDVLNDAKVYYQEKENKDYTQFFIGSNSFADNKKEDDLNSNKFSLRIITPDGFLEIK